MVAVVLAGSQSRSVSANVTLRFTVVDYLDLGDLTDPNTRDPHLVALVERRHVREPGAELGTSPGPRVRDRQRQRPRREDRHEREDHQFGERCSHPSQLSLHLTLTSFPRSAVAPIVVVHAGTSSGAIPVAWPYTTARVSRSSGEPASVAGTPASPRTAVPPPRGCSGHPGCASAPVRPVVNRSARVLTDVGPHGGGS